jgi:hypothetical protein
MFGGYTHYFESIGEQLIKCILTGEILISYEYCSLYRKSMPFLNDEKGSKNVTQSGFRYIDGMGLIKCKRGIFKPGTPEIKSIGEVLCLKTKNG